MAAVVVKFKKDRETKNTVRFKEDAPNGKEVMGTVYLNKELVSEIDATDGIELEIKATKG